MKSENNIPDRQAKIKAHLERDALAASLGATIEAVEPGYSRVSLIVTQTMTNFHGTTHGGIIFSLGDIAFAAAGNSIGQVCVALNVSINFIKASQVGDHLVAEAREQHIGGRTGVYDITITERNSGALIAKSQHVLYRTKQWFVPPE